MPEPQLISEASINIAPTDIHTQIFRNVAEHIGLKEAVDLKKPLPKILQEVPVYDIGEIIQISSKKPNQQPEYINHGLDGDVYGLKLSPNLECAIKIMHTSGLSEKKQLLSISAKPDSSQEGHNLVYKQAAGLVLGHSIEPKYVDKPHGLISYKGQVVGFIMPWYHGEPVPIDLAEEKSGDHEFHTAYHRLNNGDATLDDFYGASNSFVIDNHGNKQIKFIDITVSQETLEIDPRNPQPDGFYIQRYTKTESPFDHDTQFDSPSLDSYLEFMEQTKNYNDALVSDQNENLTFNDVCEGKALITTKAIIEKNKMSIQNITRVFDELKKLGLDVEHFGHYNISKDLCIAHFTKPNGDELGFCTGLSADGNFDPERYFRMYYRSKTTNSTAVFEAKPDINSIVVTHEEIINQKPRVSKKDRFEVDTATRQPTGFTGLLSNVAGDNSHVLTVSEIERITDSVSNTLPGISLESAEKNFQLIIGILR